MERRTAEAAPSGEPVVKGQRLPRSERRAQLLEAAQAVFVDAGFYAAAMDDIAERAGVSKPVLYQHFPGKQDLYLALLDQHARDLEDEVRAAISASNSNNKSRVYATIEAYYAFVAREGAAFRLLFESDLVNEPIVGQRLDSLFNRLADLVASAVAQDTHVDPGTANLVGMALTGMAQVSARHWVNREYRIDQEAAVKVIGSLAWRGIAGLPRQEQVAPPSRSVAAG